jgi:hypothetical protein
MRVKLNSPHNWIAPDASHHDYQPGEYTVTQECGSEMISAGKATELPAPDAPSAVKARNAARPDA